MMRTQVGLALPVGKVLFNLLVCILKWWSGIRCPNMAVLFNQIQVFNHREYLLGGSPMHVHQSRGPKPLDGAVFLG
uniref:Uncharacterized protein n=1 Tax=Solanum lycopersicum TaxID=4081 RepID=A0A3Q7FUF5_SOLLC